jgi:hypothetical protein
MRSNITKKVTVDKKVQIPELGLELSDKAISKVT